MSKRPAPGDDLSAEERRAIAEIRRELDAEFGPLEPAESLRVEPTATRAGRRGRAGSVALFLLGTILGGAVGGATGALTTLLWLRSADEPPTRSAAAVDAPAAAARESPRESPPNHSEVVAALNAWLEATRAGDVDGQMRFYPARVPVYYTWRNVTRAAVREEKVRVFGTATRLEIATDTPSVELADDGRRAVVRFRKRYLIEGPVVRRRGEVLQELEWARMPDGWRIVGERDAEVLDTGASVGPERSSAGGTIDRAR